MGGKSGFTEPPASLQFWYRSPECPSDCATLPLLTAMGKITYQKNLVVLHAEHGHGVPSLNFLIFYFLFMVQGILQTILV